MKSLALIVLIVLQVSTLTRAAGKIPCCDGKNEVYDKCGTTCPTDCANPGPLICNKMCRPGCFCKPGYIRNKKNGVCIRKEKCPNKCDLETEQFTMGVKACENNCATGMDPACAYTSYMPMNDCFCKDGYIRDVKDGKCVSVADNCPQSLCNIDTEEFRCGVKSCQYVCGVGVPEICTRARYMCKDDCFCKSDFVRDVSGNCIPNAECPSMDVIVQETTM